MIRRFFRISLWLALLPSAMLAIMLISWGLRIDTWRWNRPLYPVLMITIALFPLLIARALYVTNTHRAVHKLPIFAIGIWAVIAGYIALVAGSLPAQIYEALF